MREREIKKNDYFSVSEIMFKIYMHNAKYLKVNMYLKDIKKESKLSEVFKNAHLSRVNKK